MLPARALAPARVLRLRQNPWRREPPRPERWPPPWDLLELTGSEPTRPEPMRQSTRPEPMREPTWPPYAWPGRHRAGPPALGSGPVGLVAFAAWLPAPKRWPARSQVAVRVGGLPLDRPAAPMARTADGSPAPAWIRSRWQASPGRLTAEASAPARSLASWTRVRRESQERPASPQRAQHERLWMWTEPRRAQRVVREELPFGCRAGWAGRLRAGGPTA